MKLPGVVLLLADTLRSRAYAQALAYRGMSVDGAMLVRSLDQPRWGQATVVEKETKQLDDVFVPDLTKPLEDSVAELTRQIAKSDGGTLNGPDIVRWIHNKNHALVVFSGFGGEIVKDDVLDAGVPLLHMHSGWLPDYRGSTTLYYSYLREGWCGVTALLLQSAIDAGPMVRRKRYLPPPPGMDVDYCYDSAIRADLLVEVLDHWARHGELPPTTEQPQGGTTYYIIHPVLKHIALNGMRAQKCRKLG